MRRIALFLLFGLMAFGPASAVPNATQSPLADGTAVQLATQTVAPCHKVCAKYQFAAYKACRERCASGSTGQYDAKVARHQKCLNSCQGSGDVDQCTKDCVRKQKRLDF